MRSKIDISKVCPIERMQGDGAEDTALLKGMYEEARQYLVSFKWCREVEQAFFGLGVGGIVAAFLFKIRPAKSADEWIWVIVGDVPPAYIGGADARNPACALDGYIGAMEQWVDAVKSGKSVKNLIPVNAEPTIANADELESRLKFIDKEILSRYSADLEED